VKMENVEYNKRNNMKSNLDFVRSIYNEQKGDFGKQQEAAEQHVPVTLEEKKRFMEMVMRMEEYGTRMFGEGRKLSEQCSSLREMVDTAKRVVTDLTESDETQFEKVSLQRELKRVEDDMNLVEKTCQEADMLMERAMRAYENMSYGMNRLFGK
jgi:hypothetical protein